jgi:CRP/FNR family transcriptional regulator
LDQSVGWAGKFRRCSVGFDGPQAWSGTDRVAPGRFRFVKRQVGAAAKVRKPLAELQFGPAERRGNRGRVVEPHRQVPRHSQTHPFRQSLGLRSGAPRQEDGEFFAPQARDQIVAFQFAGEVFTVPGPDNYSYSVSALKDCDILAFDSAEFLRLASSEAGVLHHLLENTTLSLRRCREKTIALGRKTAGERIAVFLVGMAERIGVEQDGRLVLELPMSRRDISDSLGLTIETVSRQLSKLRDDGVIETVGRSGVILNALESLRDRAGFLREAA